MKKLICITLVLLLSFSSLAVFADEPITLILNGKQLNTDVAPQIVNSRTMVPFRAIFEALGIEVNWSDALRKVYATSDGVTVILTVDSDKMVVNDKVITLDAAPFISNSRTLVPVRAVCEALNCTVSWDGDKREVIIKTKDYVEPSYTETIGGDPVYVEKEGNYAESLFNKINEEREKANLPCLLYDDSLSTVAYNHCIDMSQREYIDHTSPDGVTFEARLDNSGISYLAASENIASGFTNARSVLQSWINSPKHKDNVLNPDFTKVGVGYYAGGSNGTYWTVIFIAD